jgi:acyl carrier protein
MNSITPKAETTTMMTKDAVKEKIAGFLKQPISRMQDDRLLTDLVVESFILVEMIIELQDEFGVRLVQEDMKYVKTVGELTQLLVSRAESAAAMKN